MYQPLSKLFVKNFSSETSLQEIEDLFGQYGEIYDCKINDLGKCFAVVVYRDRDAAEKAISSLNESNNLGGRLSVEFTHKRSNDGNNQRNEGGSYRDQRQGDRQNNRDRGQYSRQQNDSRYGDRGNDNRGQGRYNDRSQEDGRQNNSRYENRGYDSRGQGRFERENSERRGGEQRFQNGNYVPENQKDEYFRNGLCFNCKQSGHISRNCPQQNSKGRADGERNQDRSRSAEKKYGGYRREKEESYKGRRRSPSDSD